MNSSFFDRLDGQLREVALREPGLAAVEPRPSRRPWSQARSRRVAIAALAVLSASGTAIAATGVWRPILGDPSLGSPPTITADAPPPAQLAILGVLRRAQTAADRSRSARELEYIGNTVSGVRTTYIRLLSDDTGLGPAILVPVAALRQIGAPPAVAAHLPHTDALCLVIGDTAGAAKRCFSTSDVVTGQATLSLASDLFGIVPDDVRGVTVTFGGGATSSATPTSNFFEVTMPSGAIPRTMTWTVAGAPAEHFQL
jgi:hypothetical protein